MTNKVKIAGLMMAAVIVSGCDRGSEEPKPQVVGVTSRPAYAATQPPPESAPATQQAMMQEGPPMPGAPTAARGGKMKYAEALKAAETAPGQEVTSVSGLKYKDIAVGTGPAAEKGKRVYVRYTGWLQKGGQEFDSSYNRNMPFDFVLGRGAVIQGWDEGVAGMKVGGRRLLTIPAHLGYGSAGSGGIPGGATLVFDVELMEVK